MNLEPYSLSNDFPRLRELTQEISGLRARQAEQLAAVGQRKQQLQQAIEDDLNREARAIQHGRKPPRPQAPEVEKALLRAERDGTVLERAVEMAEADRASYIAENRSELRRAILRALWQKSLELRRHAQAAGSLFAEIEDARGPLRSLREPEVVEESGAPGGWKGNKVSNTFINVAPSSATQQGIQRGDIEAVLGHLQMISSQFGGLGLETDEGAA